MIKRIIAVIFVVLGLAALNLPPLSASGPAEMPKEIKKALDDFHAFYKKSLTQTGIVGSSILLLHDNQVVDKLSVGLADKEKTIPADERTIYHWASITKTFTGIAIMQLRDRGLLALDDPIVKYIPELRQVHDPFGDMGEITLKHLMTHSAGFRGATWPWKDKPWQPHEPTRWEQLVAMIPYTEIEFQPGSKWSYSNPGIIFLGRVIELLTGDDYEVYVDKNILKPLEMHESYFDATPYHLLKNRARSYFLAGDELIAAPFDVDTGITVSNGGLNAPILDFAKYLNFLMGDSKKQAVYDGILKRSSLEEMFKPILPIDYGTQSTSPAPEAEVPEDFSGLLFFIEKHFGRTYIGHSGGQNGFVTHFYYLPETRTSYAVAYNTLATAKDDKAADAPTTKKLDNAIRTYLFTKIFPLLAAKK
jgi:CubicO group peptidase (beta-lactamase class C family)